ncbi:MAG: sulfotransferase domain-containing protein [Robiginitomaculum sp.]|nr:sulfotransferase domain-containing protein [Robiginitomaculum sp.]MDQ7077609.1 sulfotransferase domain-containing protein [Robiginitomaculum sp.]
MSTPLIFITGAPRSGTTLVDKILWSLPAVDCFSQPLPLLLTRIKSAFLKRCDAPQSALAHPLNDQQFENAYPQNAFVDFLKQENLSARTIENAMDAMADYSGQYFKPDNPKSALADWTGSDLASFARHYFDHFAQKPHAQRQAMAWKETGAEEFLPYFLGQNMKTILILRDPRDIAASLYYGHASAHAGQPRPLLFMARQWRKSAAFFAYFSENPNVLCVRYEDLVADPNTHLKHWQDWLGLQNTKGDLTLQSQSGKSWAGNSSFDHFDGISTQGVGRHKTVLTDDERSFIEALCYGEMCMTGYTPKLSAEAVLDRLQSGPAKDYLEREGLAHYAYDETRKGEESARWQTAMNKTASFDPAMFLFADHQRAVQKVLNP